MGYERDPDRSTRGPGAIAALDAPGGRRDQVRVANARATIRRDRAMSAIGSGALGRIDAGSAGGDLGARAQVVRAPSTLVPVVPRAPLVPLAQTVFLTPKPPTSITTTRTTEGGPIRIPIDPLPQLKIMPIGPLPPIYPGQTPPIIAPPAGVTTITTSTTTSRPSGGMSSGSGTVMTTGGQAQHVAIDPGGGATPLPQIDIAPASHTTRNLMLGAGALLAAFLLFRDKRDKKAKTP